MKSALYLSAQGWMSKNYKFYLSIFLKVLFITLPFYFYFTFWISPFIVFIYEICLATLFLLPIRYRPKILSEIAKILSKIIWINKYEKNIIKIIEHTIF
jgi:hypothetical protein